jgi:hypothetical protein
MAEQTPANLVPNLWNHNNKYVQIFLLPQFLLNTDHFRQEIRDYLITTVSSR